MYRKLFIYSSALVLLATALAKLASSVGHSEVLQMSDPLLRISFKHAFLVAGIMELVVSGACFTSKDNVFSLKIIAWMATCFLVYRVGLYVIGWHKPCHCLGNLTDVIHISPDTADLIMKTILAYLLLGSYGALFFLGRNQRGGVIN
jgi:hypothetical protein